MKPMLFNTAMVQAILDGRKTVTRRVVKPQPELFYTLGAQHDLSEADLIAFRIMERGGRDCIMLPPYQPGDILYVRETFVKADDGYHYRADATPDSEQLRKAYGYKYRPSIHMPREAARIFLQVTDVRVERLQDITEEQAIAEGVRIGLGGEPYFCCRDAFIKLWDSTIKSADLPLYGWAASPWVWVVSFERIEKNEALQ